MKLNFRQGFNALRAEHLANLLPTFINGDALQIRLKFALCCLQRVTAVVAKLRNFAALLTLRHNSASNSLVSRMKQGDATITRLWFQGSQLLLNLIVLILCNGSYKESDFVR